jgi:hypothetical protein
MGAAIMPTWMGNDRKLSIGLFNLKFCRIWFYAQGVIIDGICDHGDLILDAREM